MFPQLQLLRIAGKVGLNSACVCLHYSIRRGASLRRGVTRHPEFVQAVALPLVSAGVPDWHGFVWCMRCAGAAMLQVRTTECVGLVRVR
mmetsp:Transcript_68350/g.191528  ORF Transcript_68350/g.191528 Transcript_68350/m.191528 type:complete len:89 (-) Transcript_68350:85-351(-)